jgi:hypothetical protein
VTSYSLGMLACMLKFLSLLFAGWITSGQYGITVKDSVICSVLLREPAQPVRVQTVTQRTQSPSTSRGRQIAKLTQMQSLQRVLNLYI